MIAVLCVSIFLLTNSLRSKRFRAVSDQRKTEERDSRFWPREKWNERQKMKEGGGEGEGPTPSPLTRAISFQNSTETLASQAIDKWFTLIYP